ncbi:MAG: hypothetical protein IPM54_13360 [Polyangiaceae bacterium]|nr:hypothetical protein [Polyangiaceae bacterium]
MQWEFSKTQRAHILAGIADVEPRTVQKYLDGKTVHARKRERIELAERTWTQMVTDYDEACARRKLAPVDTSDASKGTDHGHE